MAISDRCHQPPAYQQGLDRATLATHNIVLSAAVLVLSETVLVIERGLLREKAIAPKLLVWVNPIADGCRNRLRARAPSLRD